MPFLQSLFGPPDVDKMRSRRNIEGLAKAMTYEKDANIHRDAARALYFINDRRAIEPLIAALQETNIGRRQSAAKALGMIGDPRAVVPLLAALRDKDGRQDAGEALDRIGWKPGEDEDAATY